MHVSQHCLIDRADRTLSLKLFDQYSVYNGIKLRRFDREAYSNFIRGTTQNLIEPEI